MKSNLFFCNREDFVEVADLVLSESSENHVKAISRIAHWKCSLEYIPPPVLCTHSLLVIRSFNDFEKSNSSQQFNPPTASYIAEEFRNLAYASAVSRTISLLLEDNEEYRGVSMKDLASTLGLPSWLTDVRNEIAHGKRLLSVDFLSSTVDRILAWLRESFWKDLLDKYSGFVRSGGNGSPLWLQLEELLVLYEQHTYRCLTIGKTEMRVIPTRRRVAVVRQLGRIAKHCMSDFCRCFVRAGYMFPTLEQLSFLGIDQHLISLWSSNKEKLDSTNITLNKRMNSAFVKTRKFWKMLIFHLSSSSDDAVPSLIESVVQSCPASPSLFDRHIRQNCWLNYLIDKYVSRKPSLGAEVMRRCATMPTPMSLAVLRRLSFIDWPARADSKKCSNLIELMSAFVGSQDSSEMEGVITVDDSDKVFTVADAEMMLHERKN